MKKYLVYDVGGSAIKYAVMNEATIFEKDKVKTPKSNMEDFLSAIESIYQKVKDEIQGVSFSMPGIIDSETGHAVHGGSLLFIRDLNLKEVIEECLQTTIAIENDAKSAALGEVWKGKLHGIENGVAMILGTGVGGGIVLNGELIKGHHLGAGEFSSVKVDGTSINKKNNSFAEKASTVKLVQKAARLVGADQATFSGEDVFQAIKNGNQEVAELFSAYCEIIAIQILNLQAILDPERFVIGGGMSAEPMFVESIKKAVNEVFEQDPMTEINGFQAEVVKSELGNDANLYGALYQYLMSEEDRSFSENF